MATHEVEPASPEELARQEETTRVERYRKLLAFPEGAEKQPPQAAQAPRVAALQRAHDLRKFEIENYWKRSTYFWGFQLVAFAALALAAKDGRFQPPFVIIVSVLGALTALAAALTARGSKFWQANWESHVDYLESDIEGRLHKTALVERDLSYSVSRVNEGLLEALCGGWLLAFVAGAVAVWRPELMKLPAEQARYWQVLVPGAALLLGGFWIGWDRKSKLRGRAFYRDTLEPYRGSD